MNGASSLGLRSGRSFRVLSSASQVGLGSIAVLGGRFVGFLIAAQVLNARELGVFALVQSYATFIERVFNGQSWQLLVRRVAQVWGTKESCKVIPIVGAAIAADLIGGIVAFGVGALCLELFGARFGIDTSTIVAGEVYCGIVFLNAHGAWAGALRAFGKYGLYAGYQMLSGFGVVAVLGIVKWMDADPTAATLLYSWLAAELTAYSFLTCAALVMLRRNGFKFGELVRRPSALSQELISGLGFLLSLNLAGSLRMATKEGDVLAVGAAIGPEAAGAYKLGRNLSVLPLLVTDSFYYLVFPKLSALFACGQLAKARKLVRQASLLGAVVGVVSIVFVLTLGPYLLDLLSITDADVFDVMCVCIFATAVATATFPFAPALIASGDHRYQVISLAAATLAFFAAFLIGIGPLGIVGAALSGVAFYVAWIAVVMPRLISRGVL